MRRLLGLLCLGAAVPAQCTMPPGDEPVPPGGGPVPAQGAPCPCENPATCPATAPACGDVCIAGEGACSYGCISDGEECGYATCVDASEGLVCQAPNDFAPVSRGLWSWPSFSGADVWEDIEAAADGYCWDVLASLAPEGDERTVVFIGGAGPGSVERQRLQKITSVILQLQMIVLTIISTVQGDRIRRLENQVDNLRELLNPVMESRYNLHAAQEEGLDFRSSSYQRRISDWEMREMFDAWAHHTASVEAGASHSTNHLGLPHFHWPHFLTPKPSCDCKCE